MKRTSAFHKIATASRDESAQGVVEFAILATMLFFIFLGTVDFARFMYYQTNITGASRVGAEVAINHCPFYSNQCQQTDTPTATSFVMWKTYCEAAAYASLQPAYTTCSAGGSTSASWTPTCSGTCTNCTKDICLSSPDGTITNHSQITVSVGYSFKPLSLFMSAFFPERSCFTGDSTPTNHHTICASSVGRVY